MKNIIFFLLITQINNGRSIRSAPNFKAEIFSANNINHNSSKFKELPEILGTPEALVRYKHDYPITIIKHKTRLRRRHPVRRRVKQPKTKYGMPLFSPGEPLSYYQSSDNFYENYKSALTSFETNGRFNDYEGFYKELDPDFNFEDITFSKFEKQPILLNFYEKNKTNKNYSRNRSNKNKSSQAKKEMAQNWGDISTLNLENEEPEEVLRHYALKYKKKLKTPFGNQTSSTKKQSLREQYKEINQKFHIPHSKYGIPILEYNEEFQVPHNKNQYQFGEPPQENNPHHKQYINGNGVIKNNNRLKYNADSTKAFLEDITNEPPLFVQPPYKNYNGYFADPPCTQKNLKGETYLLNDHQELPLQNDVNSHYNFRKSSYDVPVYDSVPFRVNTEAENYPPLTESHLIVSESESLPSKILLTYAASNRTLTPLGYFYDNPKNISKLLYFEFNEKYIGNKQVEADISKNKTRRRKFKNRNSNRISLGNLTNTKNIFEQNYDVQFKQKSEDTGLKNDDEKKFLLLSSANKNPSNQISSLSWNPMKVTSYSFKIDHNISSSIPNRKINEKSDKQITRTTPNDKRRYIVRKNKNLNGINLFSTRKSKSHINLGKITSKNFENSSGNNENSRNTSERNQFNLDYNNFEKLNYTGRTEKEHKNFPRLTLIQDPFDFNEKINGTNSEKRQLRYKNHRYD